MNVITSSQNQLIKAVKQLKEKKYRDLNQLFFIEGTRFVEEALNEEVRVRNIFVSENFITQSKNETFLERIKSYSLVCTSDKIFKEISDTENPQGVLAVIEMKNLRIDDVFDEKNFFVVLDSIQDPGNMGTIIRTTDAVGASGVFVTKGCVDFYNPKVLRSTMGSVFHIPICFVKDVQELIDKLKEKNIKICATHLNGKVLYNEMNQKKNIAIVVGNEANGISEEVYKSADLLVKIPMPGRAESLNASVAAGLMMYEVIR